MIRESEPGHGAHAPEGQSWVGILLDAARAGGHGESVFRRDLRAWIDASASSRELVQARRDRMAILAFDLDEAIVRKQYPGLHEILKEKLPRNAEVAQARREWLNRYQASSLMPDVLRFWQRAARMLVPELDPPGYERSVAWLAAVREFDRSAGERTLSDWLSKHRRRRNLWAEIARRGLPLPAPASGRGRP